jgi:hypothetical protein
MLRRSNLFWRNKKPCDSVFLYRRFAAAVARSGNMETVDQRPAVHI